MLKPKPPGVMATECRHSSEMALDEQETIMMNRAMKKKEAWYDLPCDSHRERAIRVAKGFSCIFYALSY